MKIALLQKDLLPWHITIWCISLFQCHKQWRFRMQRLPWTRNGKSSRESQHGTWEKSRAKKEVFLEAQRETKRKSTLLHWWTYVNSKKTELEPKLQKYKSRVLLRVDIVKEDSGAHAVFADKRLVCVSDDCCKDHGCYFKITRLRWTSSWCSICLHPGKIGGCSQIAQNSPNRNVQMFGIRLPRHKRPKSWG